MLTAVASRRAGLELSNQDTIVSVAGGFQVSEPAADLAITLAMASSLHNAPIDPGLVAFGEVGLSGELRAVPQPQRRLEEAARLGFSRCTNSENQNIWCSNAHIAMVLRKSKYSSKFVGFFSHA